MEDKENNITHPFFCFICGSELEECRLGWLQCTNENCLEVFLPYLDEDNNQCLGNYKRIE